MIDKEKLLGSFSEFLDNHFGSTKNVEIAKSVDIDKKMATFVVLAPEEVDAHGDIYSHDVVEDACYQYNEYCYKCNLEHMLMIDESTAEVIESYIAPVDFQLDETLIKKGTWLQTWKFNSDELWNQVKEGHWTGLSVQCMGEVEDITNGS
jgi:hypothetical protein